MPTDIMHAVRMHPISDLQHPSSAVPLRLLNRGPDYLRRQMEVMGTPRGRVSAVERLAADKAKYVKSPQTQGVCGGSSSGGSREDHRGSSASDSSSGGSSRGSSCKKSQQQGGRPGSPGTACQCHKGIVCHQSTASPCQQGTAPVRRGSSKRQMRPDSLVIYRQKSRGDGQLATAAAEQARAGLVRRLFQGSMKEKPPIMSRPTGESPSCTAGRLQGTPERERSRTGLHRSQSDISSRYSRSFSEFDHFFQFCGLEPEVVEELGRDRFTPAPEELLDLAGQHRIRSVSVATSESGMSRRSGGECSAGGQQEDEPLSGQLPGANSNTSVIERNARIIKWLYSCKRAKETRGGSPDLP
ncbi:protein FAM110C [Rhinophrynus dorsalis]